jgi:DNA gyrase subunit A
MQLRRLAALERQKLQDEYDQVQSRIEHLEDLLNSPQKILQLIREDLQDIAEKYGDDRNTAVEYGNADFEEMDLYRKENVVISLTQQGYIKRVPASAYRAQRRGGKGMRGMATKDTDTLQDVFFANSHDTILFFSNKGKVYSQMAYHIAESQREKRGILIQSLLPIESDEQITAILPVDFTNKEEIDEAYFILATQQGRVKRVALEEFADVRPSGLIAMSINEDDTLRWVKWTNGEQHIVLVSANGQSIRFAEDDVRVMGRQAGGVNGMRLVDDDEITGMDVVTDEHTHILVVTQNGYGKRTQIDQYNTQGRYGLGARTIKRNKRTGPVVAMRCITEEDGIMLITKKGIVLRTYLNEIRETGRSTQGVKLMNLKRGDEVAGIAIMSGDDGGDEFLEYDEDDAVE